MAARAKPTPTCPTHHRLPGKTSPQPHRQPDIHQAHHRLPAIDQVPSPSVLQRTQRKPAITVDCSRSAHHCLCPPHLHLHCHLRPPPLLKRPSSATAWRVSCSATKIVPSATTPPPPQAPRLPPACYRCGQPGHKMATCPQNASKPAQQRSPRTTTHTPTTSAQPAHHAATTTRSPTPARSHPPPFVTSNRLQSLTPQPHPPQPPRPAARHLPAPRLDPRLAARHHQAQALRLHAAYLGAAMAGILDAEDADSPPRKRPTGPRQYWAYIKSVAIIPTSHPPNVPWFCPFPVCPLAISHQSADRDKRKLLLCCGDVEENPGPAKHSPSVPQHGLSTLWNQRTGNPPIACDPSGMQATDFPVTNVETGHPSPSPKRPRTDTEGDSLMAETPGALSSMMPDSMPQPGQSGCPDKVSCAGLPDGNGNLVAVPPPHCPIPPTPTQ